MKRMVFVKPHWAILIVLLTMDLGWMLVDLGLVNCGPLTALLSVSHPLFWEMPSDYIV